MKQSGVSLLHSCSPSIGRPHRLTPIWIPIDEPSRSGLADFFQIGPRRDDPPPKAEVLQVNFMEVLQRQQEIRPGTSSRRCAPPARHLWKVGPSGCEGCLVRGDVQCRNLMQKRTKQASRASSLDKETHVFHVVLFHPTYHPTSSNYLKVLSTGLGQDGTVTVGVKECS